MIVVLRTVAEEIKREEFRLYKRLLAMEIAKRAPLTLEEAQKYAKRLDDEAKRLGVEIE